MRKIISILIALGLILGLSVMTAPAAGQVPAGCALAPAIDNACEGGTATYCINFTAPVTLAPINDMLAVEFAAGTNLTAVTNASVVVTVGAASGSPPSVTKTATKVMFPVPIPVGTITAGTMVRVCIGDVVNPAAGTRTLRLSYKLVCCAEEVWCSVNTTIRALRSTYDFFWHSGPTYPGIAAGFIPPFKACGQNVSYDGGVPAVPLPAPATGFLNAFNITLGVVGTAGCLGPCTQNVSVVLNMTSSPAGANVTIGLNSSTSFTNLVRTTAIPQPQVPVGSYLLGNSTPLTWTNYIHFNVVGDYELCFRAICPPEPTCPDCLMVSRVIAEECFRIRAHQEMEAFKLELREKWNLISLPLVPLVEGGIPVADALASISAGPRGNITAIWHYDRCAGAAGTWFVWPTPGTGQTALARLDAGKAYWVRVLYPITSPLCGNITWWTFGTAKPVPPASPAQYAVCTGWNMLGFTSLSTAMNPDDYLWNWVAGPQPVVYGWQPGCWDGRGAPAIPQQGWDLVNFTGETLTPGQGYWVAFPASGAVFVP